MFMAACDKENNTEYLFDKSINERFAEKKTEIINDLTAPANGWIGYYAPNGEVGAFTLLLKFDADGKVLMSSDYNQGEEDATITYNVIKKQQIELVFETHAVLHAIYETNQNGIGGEYIFNIANTSENEVLLSSKTDNGYAGDVVTELVLAPASAEDWNLDGVYESEANVVGNPTQSVFRNFKANGNPIASFSYNSATRVAQVAYIDGNTVARINAPIQINKNGFCLVEPIDIGNSTLDCFTYNAETEIFESSSGVTLMYDMEPGVPLAPYDFGVFAGAALLDKFELQRSSQNFQDFYASYMQLFAGYGVALDRVYLNDLDSAPYIFFTTNFGNFWYDFTYEIKEDGKVYFTLTGATNAADVHFIFEPFLEKIFNTNGHFIENTGKMIGYPNTTFALINADDPSLKINFINLN